MKMTTHLFFLKTLFVKHYAPRSCSSYECIFGFVFCLIARNNPCILAFLLVLPRAFVRVTGFTWQDSFRERVSKMISFVDSVPVVPDCANNKSHEYFDDCAEDLFHDVRLERFSRLDILYSIAFIFYMAQARFNYFAEDSDKLRVIVASAETRRRWFVQDFFSLTSNFIIPGVMAHGQCWMMRLPLFNTRVHTDEDLRIYNTSGIRAFSPIIADLVGLTCEEIVEKLKNCTVAQGFARRDGCDIDDELTKVRMQAILDGCRNGGRIVGKAHADRWKCLREAFELFSEHMMKEYAVEASF